MKHPIRIFGLSATVALASVATLAFFFLLPVGGGDDPCKTCGAHPVATKADDCNCPIWVWVDEAAAKEFGLKQGWLPHRDRLDPSKVYSLEEMRKFYPSSTDDAIGAQTGFHSVGYSLDHRETVLIPNDTVPTVRPDGTPKTPEELRGTNKHWSLSTDETGYPDKNHKKTGFRCPRYLTRTLGSGDAAALSATRFDRGLAPWLYFDQGKQKWFLSHAPNAPHIKYDVPHPACSHLIRAITSDIPHPAIDDGRSYEAFYGVGRGGDTARRPFYDPDPNYQTTSEDQKDDRPKRLHSAFDGDKQKALLNLRDLFYHPEAGRIDPKTNEFWCRGDGCRYCDAVIEIALEGVTSDNFKYTTDLDRDRRLFDAMRRLERDGDTPKPPAAVPVDDDTTRAERRAKLFDQARAAREELGKLRYDESQLRLLADAYGDMKMSDRKFALDLLAKIARQEDLLAEIEMGLDQALLDLLDLYEKIAAKVQARRYFAPSDLHDRVERKKRLEARKQIDLEIEALKEKLREGVEKLDDPEGLRFSSSALSIDEISMGEGGAAGPGIQQSLDVSIGAAAAHDRAARFTPLHRGKAFIGADTAETVERPKQRQHQLLDGRREQDQAEADRAAQMKRQEEDEKEAERQMLEYYGLTPPPATPPSPPSKGWIDLPPGAVKDQTGNEQWRTIGWDIWTEDSRILHAVLYKDPDGASKSVTCDYPYKHDHMGIEIDPWREVKQWLSFSVVILRLEADIEAKEKQKPEHDSSTKPSAGSSEDSSDTWSDQQSNTPCVPPFDSFSAGDGIERSIGLASRSAGSWADAGADLCPADGLAVTEPRIAPSRRTARLTAGVRRYDLGDVARIAADIEITLAKRDEHSGDVFAVAGQGPVAAGLEGSGAPMPAAASATTTSAVSQVDARSVAGAAAALTEGRGHQTSVSDSLTRSYTP